MKRPPTKADFWRVGSLQYMLRRHGQLSFYNALKAWKVKHPLDIKPFVAICRRHFGKTTAGVVYGWERCVKDPGTHVLFIAPQDNQCERNMEQPLALLSREYQGRIQVKRHGREYFIRNYAWPSYAPSSVFRYIGSDGTGEREIGAHLRGIGKQDVIIVDEARDTKRLDFLWDNVLRYSFQKTRKPTAIFITTPPPSMDHPLTRPGGFIDQARQDGRLFVATAAPTDQWPEACVDLDFSKADEAEILSSDSTGQGKTSNAWRREALCELIQDTETATIPQYGDTQKIVEVASYTRPAHYIPLVVADTGWEPDPTAILAGYVDYQAQVLVVENERIIRHANTRDFAEAMKEIERETFHEAGKAPKNPVRRHADSTPAQLDDLWNEHRMRVWPADKYDFAGALARLRTAFAEKRIRILPKARQLRYQCLTGLLDKKGKLERTETLGHQDAVAALIYMCRMAPWDEVPGRDPLPYGEDMWVHPEAKPKRPVPAIDREALTVGGILPMRPGYALPEEMWE